MNFLDLRTRAAYLASFGTFNQSAPAPDWAALINRALADFAWATEYNVEQSTVTTVASQAEYTLDPSATPRYWRYITDCAYGTNTRLVQTTEQTERQNDPLWLVKPAGTPSRYYVSKPNVLRLCPGPTQAGVVVTVRGPREPPLLVADADTPGFPNTWHEAVALRAAYLYAQLYARTSDDWQRLNIDDKKYDDMVRSTRRWIAEDDAQLQRTTITRLPDRIDASGFNYYPG